MKRIVTTSFVVALAILAGLLPAQDKPAATSRPADFSLGIFGPMADRLKLTDDQKAQIRTILKDGAEKAKATPDRIEQVKIARAAAVTVANTVLTEEQRKIVAEIQKEAASKRRVTTSRPATSRPAVATSRPAAFSLGLFGPIADRLKLTDDQKAQIRTILKDGAEKAKATPDRIEKVKIARAAALTVVNTVLTEEQGKVFREIQREKTAKK